MRWMTPLVAGISGVVTFAPLTVTPLAVLKVTACPSTVVTGPSLMSAAITEPGTTW